MYSSRENRVSKNGRLGTNGFANGFADFEYIILKIRKKTAYLEIFFFCPGLLGMGWGHSGPPTGYCHLFYKKQITVYAAYCDHIGTRGFDHITQLIPISGVGDNFKCQIDVHSKV